MSMISGEGSLHADVSNIHILIWDTEKKNQIVRFMYSLWNYYEYIRIKCGLFNWRQIDRVF